MLSKRTILSWHKKPISWEQANKAMLQSKAEALAIAVLPELLPWCQQIEEKAFVKVLS